jgi:site-specific DNA-cytosine methylase
MKKKLKSMDLFSGIGGMSLALHGVAEPILYCDILPEAQKVIESNIGKGNLPRAPVIDDVRKVRMLPANKYRPDLICGGFPCVGFSNSGLREGFKNEKTSIYSELIKVVDKFAPPLVFMENVQPILGAMDTIRKDFSGLGYDLAWMVLAACEVGAPQRRSRWFCLAYKPKEFADMKYDVPTTKVFDWTQVPEPAKTTNRPYLPMRGGLLGNSVVPEAARTAFAYLTGIARSVLASGGRIEGSTPISSTDKHPKYGYTVGPSGYRLAPRWHPKLQKCPNMGIVLDPGIYQSDKPFPNVPRMAGMVTEPIEKRLWATPRFGNSTAMGKHLTRRSRNDLGTQIRFFRTNEPKKKYANIHFVEWLMGFPKDWTDII